jgi:hypothetical protein
MDKKMFSWLIARSGFFRVRPLSAGRLITEMQMGEKFERFNESIQVGETDSSQAVGRRSDELE